MKTLLFSTLLLAVTLCFVSSYSLPYVIVETMQTKFYSNNQEINEPSVGDPFYGQDATYQGVLPSYTDNGDGTVTDNNTGLIWQKSPDFVHRFWADAMTYADTLNLAGLNDWRLPSIKELYSLVASWGNQHDLIPYLDTTVFDFQYPNTSGGLYRIMDAQFWSSNKYVGTTMNDAESAFGYNHADGRIKSYPLAPKSGKGHWARCVRGNPDYGKNDFVDNGNGTVTDRATGLMWQKVDDGNTRNWQAALTYAEGLALAGHSDWRLPDIKELQSIVDYTRSPIAEDPAFRTAAIDPDFFEVTNMESWFWTGTTLGDNIETACYVCFGQASAYSAATDTFSVDAHGAGAQRSDPKEGDPADWPEGHGPQADQRRIYNYVRCVRNAEISLIEDNIKIPSNTGPRFGSGIASTGNSLLLSIKMTSTEHVQLSLYAVSGQRMAVLHNGTLSAGHHHFKWQPGSIPNGVYVCVLKAGNHLVKRTIPFVK